MYYKMCSSLWSDYQSAISASSITYRPNRPQQHYNYERERERERNNSDDHTQNQNVISTYSKGQKVTLIHRMSEFEILISLHHFLTSPPFYNLKAWKCRYYWHSQISWIRQQNIETHACPSSLPHNKASKEPYLEPI